MGELCDVVSVGDMYEQPDWGGVCVWVSADCQPTGESPVYQPHILTCKGKFVLVSGCISLTSAVM